MGTGLLTTIQRFELLAFFSGYPVLYTLVSIISGSRLKITGSDPKKLLPLLGAAYASVGTGFLFFLLWPSFHAQPFAPADLSIVALRTWGVLAILFWLPRLRNLPVASLLHSVIFFGLVALDIIEGGSSLAGREEIRNDMLLFTVSVLLNAATFSLVLLVVFIRRIMRRRNA